MTAMRPPGTVLQQPVFSVDGWAGNTVDAEGVEWWVTKEEGWASSPAVRLTMTDRPERDGAFDAPSYRSPRVITLEGTAIAPDRISKERAKDGLAAVLNDGSRLFPLVVTEPHAVRRAMVRLSGESKIMDKKAGAFEFSVQVTAPDPLRYSAELRVATCPLPSSAGGLSFPLAFPLDFGTGATGGRLSLENNGTVAAWPTWKISGPCADPVLINTQTGEELAFQIQLAAGEVLVVDTDARTVLLQGLASRRSVMLPHSRWFPLVRGGIDVAFRAGAYNPAARLTAEWRDAWS
ncbi:phage tail protein [Amycolatopsis sp. WAC 01376]|uniref:phage distal tail protein n=1 Tax=Amycolatopsis sp. WAC 01376 TaxID=2203195 RepID=UPI000F776660|nr:phage tail domain-containing protein [Amycolatopsis sp. WAC 01376]RSM63678.1 phage tail protein [Amycolatopsis sp. WAC 01376]